MGVIIWLMVYIWTDGGPRELQGNRKLHLTVYRMFARSVHKRLDWAKTIQRLINPRRGTECLQDVIQLP